MRQTKKSKAWLVLLLLSGIVFLTSVKVLMTNYTDDVQEESEFKALSQRVESARLKGQTKNAQEDMLGEQTALSDAKNASGSDSIDEPAYVMLDEYAELVKENPDLGGWIRIDGTIIDYPVMLTPDEPEKYLHLSFDGRYSKRGVPFIGEGCTIAPRSQNIVVYGHHMKNGSMFAAIVNYKDIDFWRKHPTIFFSTLYEEGEYEVFAAFETDMNAAKDLRCYDFLNAKDETDFDDYIGKIEKAALYDTDVEVSYSDELLTLSTCAYHTSNGRFVVAARKKA